MDDLTPPYTPIVTDEGQWTESSTQLYCSWTADDPESGIAEYQYRITKDSTTGAVIRDWTSTGTVNSVTAGALTLENGKTYYFAIKAINGVGLESIGYSDGIIVDAVPPTGTVSINNGAVYTTNTSVSLSLSANDGGSGMGTGAQMKFSNDNTNWSTPEAYSTSKTWTLSSGNGTKTVYAKFKDVAGNWMTNPVSDTIILDTTAPIISSVTAGSITDNSAVITWTTNETSDSQVEYGLTTSYGSLTTLNTNMVISHSASLSGLTSGILYHYRVRSRDVVGNPAISGDYTFTTLKTGVAK